MRRTVAHVVVVVMGIAIAVLPLVIGLQLPIRCRGVVMQPGSVCAKADGSQTQSYEQRLQARRNAVPVTVVVGLLVVGFGAGLMVAQRSKTVAS